MFKNSINLIVGFNVKTCFEIELIEVFTEILKECTEIVPLGKKYSNRDFDKAFIPNEVIHTMRHEHEHERNDHTPHDGGHNGHRGSMADDEVKVDWQIVPEHLGSDQEAEITLTVKNHMGVPLPAFVIVHEQQMHLLAISQDLSSFHHLHPKNLGKGNFTVKTKFPEAGKYKLFAEFMPEGSSQQLATYDLRVNGKESNKPPVQQDQKLQKTINGLRFALKAEQMVANQNVALSFFISDVNTGEPVTELEPYLGSAGHVVIVSRDLVDFLHVHPTDEDSKGPTVSYMTSFPKPGIYKIWGQFKYKGDLYTVPFVVNIAIN